VEFNNAFLGSFALPAYVGSLPVSSDVGGQLALSEVCNILLLPLGGSFPTTWSDLTSLQAAIDNTDTTGGYGKWLPGKGSIPASNVLTAPMGRQHLKKVGAEYTLTFEVPIWCAAYYEACRTIQKNPTYYYLWFFTVAGFGFGGQNGIRPYYLHCDLPKGGSDGAVEVGIITIRWRADGDPARVSLPGLNGGTDETSELSITMYRQQFTSVSSSTLTWTQNNGDIPPAPTVRLWVYQNGQKLMPGAYVVTEGTGVGESEVVIDSTYYTDGNTYEIFAFF